MRISDWSSDVCSSDLRDRPQADGGARRALTGIPAWQKMPRDGRRDGNAGYQLAGPQYPIRLRIFSLRHRFIGLRRRLRPPWAMNASIASSTRSRSEEHTSEPQSLMRISYAVFCLKKKKYNHTNDT